VEALGKVLICSEDMHALSRWQQTLRPMRKVQTASSAREMQQILRFQTPDLILFHIDGTKNRIDEALTAVLENDSIHTLVLDEDPNDADGVVLVKAGVRGYANAGMDGRLLQSAVSSISEGEVWVSRRIMQTLVNELLNGGYESEQSAHPSLKLLTDRELEIAELVAEGSSNKMVATRLGITERTVKAHLTSSFNKTGARGRLELSLMVKGEFSPRPADIA